MTAVQFGTLSYYQLRSTLVTVIIRHTLRCIGKSIDSSFITVEMDNTCNIRIIIRTSSACVAVIAITNSNTIANSNTTNRLIVRIEL